MRILSPLAITFISRRRTKRKNQTNHKTQHRQKHSSIKAIFRGNQYELTPRFQTNRLIQVTAVAQPPANNKGKTIFGVTDPCSLKKKGNLEYVLGSIGPL